MGIASRIKIASSNLSKSASASGQDASRRAFLGRSTGLALATVGSAALLGTLSSKAKADITTDGLDYSLPFVRGYFRQIQGHENAHVPTLVSTLGKSARPEPTYHNLVQDTMQDFIDTAQALENTGVGAYLAALPYIQSKSYLAAAGSIALIEARHAGMLNFMQGDPVTGHASDLTDDENFESTLTIAQVTAGAGVFLKSLNGGPALTFTTTLSAANDIAILNFALALEYLEREFYNVNIHRFFGYSAS